MSTAAVPINFYAHLPGIRLAEEQLGLADFTLWRMPFAVFNGMTGGAWGGWSDRYNTTAPVFVYASTEMSFDALRPGELPNFASLDMKFPIADIPERLSELGLDFLANLHEDLADLQAALALAAPASGPISALWSVSFASPEEAHFEVAGNSFAIVHLQGDADVELAFQDSAAGQPLTPTDVARAELLLPLVVNGLRQNPDLSAALDVLLRSSDPTLSAVDALTLAVMATEGLMLPEVRKGLCATFTRRLTNLLGHDEDHRRALERVARRLYDARSAEIHGDAGRALSTDATEVMSFFAPQLLAATIVCLGTAVASDISLDEVRSHLDQGPPPEDAPYRRKRCCGVEG